ncbi:MAG: hypothetical protein AAGA92_02175 [Planctomycetota bacterium]
MKKHELEWRMTTDRQADLLAAVRSLWKRNRRGPSLREIGQEMGGIHVNAVKRHLDEARRKGYAERVDGKASVIRRTLPILGTVRLTNEAVVDRTEWEAAGC